MSLWMSQILEKREAELRTRRCRQGRGNGAAALVHIAHTVVAVPQPAATGRRRPRQGGGVLADVGLDDGLVVDAGKERAPELALATAAHDEHLVERVTFSDMMSMAMRKFRQMPSSVARTMSLWVVPSTRPV